MTAVVASTAFGPMIVPPYDTYLSQALIRLGQYAPAEFATWRPFLPAGGTVVDAGANVGAHTLAFAAAVGAEGSVFAVEPQRTLFYMLCGTIALGNLQHVITATQCALGREPGQVRVPPLDYSAPNNFGGLELRDVKEGEAVPCVPLDSVTLERLDFLKIDVEGMELDVLHGATETVSRHRPVISAEADREKNVPALLGWFRLNRYRVWWHKPPLGPLWPRVVSVNLLALPRDREDLPLPEGDVEVAVE
jgi:FkbM family methyltransferase